jgi:D-sedoheptulose 7-phosphate isomerase
MKDFLEYKKEVISVLERMNEEHQKSIDFVRNSLLAGVKIYTCGNGGSASTAMHYTTDWSKGLSLQSDRNCNAISLNSNISMITAIGNDFSYEDVFSYQLKLLGVKGDVLVVVSGSGNSQNIIRALEMAREKHMTTVGVVGFDGGKCIELLDYSFHIPSHDMQIFEDISSIFGHAVLRCE